MTAPRRDRAMTDEQASRALELAAAGRTALSIAREFGVPRDSVRRLLRGELYRHVPGERPPPGPRYPPRGAGHHHHGKRKLGAGQVAELLRLWREEGVIQRESADRFGVSISTVQAVCQGRYGPG
jgi:hypothetical protein